MEKIVILSGAGISAESGVKTFRDAGGLWEGHDVMTVASIDGWHRNPELVLDFYNQRRRQLHEVEPNPAHHALVELESQYEVVVITQNVDDLHERAGSSHIIHLHGELRKAKSSIDDTLIYDCPGDIRIGDTCELGSQLRPHVVWFGEQVPKLHEAALHITDAHHILIVGTSMQVYPAAGLVGYAREESAIYYVDPNPRINFELSRRDNLRVVPEKAAGGLPKLVQQLLTD